MLVLVVFCPNSVLTATLLEADEHDSIPAALHPAMYANRRFPTRPLLAHGPAHASTV